MRSVLFRAPALDPTPELRWLLHRAFARPGLPAPPPGDPAAALDLALHFDLAPRIAARSAPDRLKEELGPVASRFSRAAYLAAVSGLRYEGTLHRVARVADEHDSPLVVLKGGALSLLGVCAPGARSLGDLDLLVPRERVRALRDALVASGWTLSGLPESEHQEAPLTHPSFGMIELHRCVPGVRPPGSRRSFDARTLIAAGLSEEAGGFGRRVLVPARPVLVAHALEHGLVQHGNAPGSYPLFRFLADLKDLDAGPPLLREAGAYLRDLDQDDLGTIAVLLEALDSGRALDLEAGAPRSLLEHVVNGVLDPGYALGLKSDPRSLRSPSDLPRPLALLAWVYKAAVLNRAQVDAIYGRPRRPGGTLARQLLRPFDLVLRFVRSRRARRSRPE